MSPSCTDHRDRSSARGRHTTPSTRIKPYLNSGSVRIAVLALQPITTSAEGAETARNNHQQATYMPFWAHIRAPAPPCGQLQARPRAPSPPVPPQSRQARPRVAGARPCVQSEGWERQVGQVKSSQVCAWPPGVGAEMTDMTEKKKVAKSSS